MEVIVFLLFNSCTSVSDLFLSSHSRPLWFLKFIKSFSTKLSTQTWPLSFQMTTNRDAFTLDVYCYVLEHTSLAQKLDWHKSSPVSEGGRQKERKGHLWLEKTCPHPSKAGGMCQESLLRIEESCLPVAVHCGCERQLQIVMWKQSHTLFTPRILLFQLRTDSSHPGSSWDHGNSEILSENLPNTPVSEQVLTSTRDICH